jgi:hypothetical protein
MRPNRCSRENNAHVRSAKSFTHERYGRKINGIRPTFDREMNRLTRDIVMQIYDHYLVDTTVKNTYTLLSYCVERSDIVTKYLRTKQTDTVVCGEFLPEIFSSNVIHCKCINVCMRCKFCFKVLKSI